MEWYKSHIPCWNGYPQGTLNQGIDVPHRYPKMGDWSGVFIVKKRCPHPIISFFYLFWRFDVLTISQVQVGAISSFILSRNHFTNGDLAMALGVWPLQSPIFGYLWGTSIPWFRAPRGYPFCGGKWIPYQYHHTVEWKTHTIPHSYQYHVTYHTIPYHTIPFDLISYHQGCLGSFHQIWKVFLQAAILVRWAPSFVDRFFRFLLSF